MEKAVDCVRKLANTLLDMVRERSGLTLGTESPLFSWAFVHAAFLLNRFRVTGNLTAYERSTGARYSGRIAPFGEPVYAQVTPKQKGNPRWIVGILLSKSTVNDMFVIGGRDGVRLSRSIRRTGQSWSVEQKLYNELGGEAVGLRQWCHRNTVRAVTQDSQAQCAVITRASSGFWSW